MREGLPPIYDALLPELSERWPAEVLATCADCAMRPRGAPRPGHSVFTDSARCCTYEPTLPNHAVGRILRTGGTGAAFLRRRLAASRDGLEAARLTPTTAARKLYANRGPDDYGNRADLRCSFWDAGRCTVHVDRGAACRTWFCKSTHGRPGQLAWRALREALFAVENALADRCVADGTPPDADAPLAAWEAWYRWCADHVDQLDPATVDIAPALGEQVRDMVAHRDAPLPDVVHPLVTHRAAAEGRVALSAWSTYDLVDVPPWVFTFLAELDGQRTWRDAKDRAEHTLGHPVPDDLVLSLWRRGLLVAPGEVGSRGPSGTTDGA